MGKIHKLSKEYSVEDLKRWMRVPCRQKLEWLEAANRFFVKFTPKKTQKIAQHLKFLGF